MEVERSSWGCDNGLAAMSDMSESLNNGASWIAGRYFFNVVTQED